MKKALNKSIFLLLLFNTWIGYSQTCHPEPVTLKIGSKAPDFSLTGIDGKAYSLKSFEKAPVLVIIFSCNHCPTAQAYEDRIIAIEKNYRSKGVSLVMISPNSTKQDVLSFQKQHEASNKNYIFNKDDVYQIIEAIDPQWHCGLPYTMVNEPGGKIIYRKQDIIDPAQMKKLIVDDTYIGRYY
jgi:peroxiredoxin